MASTDIQSIYQKYNPVTYVKDHYSIPSRGHEMFFKFLNEVYNSDKFKGTSFLDLGSGPTPHWLAAPSRKYSDITVSELLESNLIELNKWLHNDQDALEWTTAFKWAAAAENISDYTVITERLRKAVKHIIACDVLQENPLLSVTKQFDVVQCSFVVDSAAQEQLSLKRIIKNISNVVKPGGALVMINTMGATYWKVGSHKFPKMNINKNILEDALLEAGFEDLDFCEILCQEQYHHICDRKGYIMGTAFKKQ